MNSGVLPPLQPHHQFSPNQRESAIQIGLGLYGDIKNGFLVAGTAYFTFLAYLYRAKSSVSAGATTVLPPAGQGTSHLFNSTATGAPAILTSHTAISLFGKQHAAGRSSPQAWLGQASTRTGRKTNTGWFFTIVLREKPTCFQVKLLLTDLLLEPELQVGPVPREERGSADTKRKALFLNPLLSPTSAEGPGARPALRLPHRHDPLKAGRRGTGRAATRPGPARRDTLTAARPRPPPPAVALTASHSRPAPRSGSSWPPPARSRTSPSPLPVRETTDTPHPPLPKAAKRGGSRKARRASPPEEGGGGRWPHACAEPAAVLVANGSGSHAGSAAGRRGAQL